MPKAEIEDRLYQLLDCVKARIEEIQEQAAHYRGTLDSLMEEEKKLQHFVSDIANYLQIYFPPVGEIFRGDIPNHNNDSMKTVEDIETALAREPKYHSSR